MATRTAFSLTGDSQSTRYPEDSGWSGDSDGSVASQADGRYAKIGTLEGTYSYPKSDDGFNVPKIRFGFLNAYGERISRSPIVYLRLPTNFNVTGFSDYNRAEGVFASASDSSRIIADALQNKVGLNESLSNATAGVLDKVGNAGLTGIEAVQYSIQRGLAQSLGFIGSAGLSNLGQYEFNTRTAVNPMAQLLYKGPQFRRYQLPFTIHPKSKEESDEIKKIISIFRVASSPAVPDVGGIYGSANSSISIGVGNSFTFGYPHLTHFSVAFITPGGAPKKIFRSKACVIESVSVDYGGQKMSLFEDGNPAEITLTLQLSETTPRTLGDAYTDANATEVTIL